MLTHVDLEAVEPALVGLTADAHHEELLDAVAALQLLLHLTLALMAPTQTERGDVALPVHVDDEDLLVGPPRRQLRREVEREHGLANASLVVVERERLVDMAA